MTTEDGDAAGWEHDGVRVIPDDSLDADTPRAPGVHREEQGRSE